MHTKHVIQPYITTFTQRAWGGSRDERVVRSNFLKWNKRKYLDHTFSCEKVLVKQQYTTQLRMWSLGAKEVAAEDSCFALVRARQHCIARHWTRHKVFLLLGIRWLPVVAVSGINHFLWTVCCKDYSKQLRHAKQLSIAATILGT